LPESAEQSNQVNISDFSSENVTIKKYDPKCIKKPFVASKKEEYLISPLTGEKILASKLSEHMRIGLLDPRWIEQRDKLMEKTQEPSVYGSGETVIDNLKHLAERRTDIFGEGDKETVIGKKIGEEEKKENPVIWDGHMISVESTTRAMNKNIASNNIVQPKLVQSNQFMPLNHVTQSNYVKEVPHTQITMQNNEFKVPLPPPPQRYPNYQTIIRHRAPLPVPPPLMMMNHPPRYPIQPVPFFRTPLPPIPPISLMFEPPFNISEDEHPPKKVCTESKLIPEDEFIKMFTSPINIQVQVPTVEKSEWKLNGQKLSIDIDLKDTIASLKQKIQEQTDMPPTKQKISFNGIFLKDNFSVAYYNILNNSTVNLQIKERGGRKK
jgi:splicing factor 3A subunit 1